MTNTNLSFLFISATDFSIKVITILSSAKISFREQAIRYNRCVYTWYVL